MTLHEAQYAGKASDGAKRLSLHALVLAAGLGRRFGSPKLHAVYRHRPLLAYPLALVAAARDHGLVDAAHVVIAVNDDAALGLVHRMKLKAILNDAPERGLSHSLQLGLTAVAHAKDTAGALIFLGDQPLVRLETVETIISAWHAGGPAIVRPRYGSSPDVPGHPVVLPRKVWPLIQHLEGDVGFNGLGDDMGETLVVDVPGHNPDVDTPQDLQALESFPR